MRGLGIVAAAMIAGAAATGCDESDATSIRIRLKNDFSGTLVASAIAAPGDTGSLEKSIQGAALKDRIQMNAVSGSFDHLSKLAFEDVAFVADRSADGVSHVKATLRRGAQSRWARAIVPLPAAERKRLGPIFDTSGDGRDIGAKVKLQIDLPSRVIAHGIDPIIAGVKEDAEGTRATLIVPVDAALADGPDVVWLVSWRE
jgi:hypothetical protein